jgi:hypothetical protein
MAKGVPRDLVNYPQWLHAELLNWSRWCWQGPWPHPLPPSVCASVERDYIPAGNAEERVAAERKPIPPNERHAQIVDSVWKRMADAPRRVLRAEYPQRFESGRMEFGRIGAAKGLGMGVVEYERQLIVAIGQVWDAFEGAHALR